MNWFFTSNDPAARLLRTIIQGVIGVVVSYLSIVSVNAPEIVALLIIPIIMAILAPIMGLIGTSDNTADHETKIGGSN